MKKDLEDLQMFFLFFSLGIVLIPVFVMKFIKFLKD
jgi:hypothetical protein